MSRANEKKKALILKLIVFAVLSAALLISLIWQDKINAALGLTGVEENEYDGMNTDAVLSGSGGDLNLHFVDVGQGDACIVELPDGRNMLIDSGSSDRDDKLISYIDENIKDDDGKTIGGFDIVIMTHSDEDHCGEMADVLGRFPAKEAFYRPNQEATRSGFSDPGKADLYGNYNGKSTKAYAEAIGAGYAGGAKGIVTNALDDSQNVIAPENVARGEEGYYEINFYSPVKDSYGDYNNYSPIIVLEYNDNKVALSGDAEKEAEADFVEKAKAGEGRYAAFTEEFTVQAIKLGHHGSRTSSSEDYLETMTTAASRKDVRIIISCGKDNKYGHPHAEVMERLEKMGFSDDNILRTDINGSIAMSIKFDEASGEYALFVGADVVRVDTAVGFGAVKLTWFEIVIVVIILSAIIMFVMPLLTRKRRR
ncbi:MAG: MBL fold metallo-hydrolase [Clostridia bacterium]|nr:MBL fold metallo-hydrolase [Clostridia bacterium]